MLLVPVKELIVPPERVTSFEAKFVVASLMVNVRLRLASLVVEPLDKAFPSLSATAKVIVGGVLSLTVTVLLLWLVVEILL